VQQFQQAVECMTEDDTLELRLRVLPPKQGGKDPLRYNTHTAPEVGVLLPNDVEYAKRPEIVLRLRTGGLKDIRDSEPCYLPCRFPLIHTKGEDGWHDEIPLKGNGVHSAGEGARGEDDDENHGAEEDELIDLDSASCRSPNSSLSSRSLAAIVARKVRGGSTRVSRAMWHAYRLHERGPTGASHLHHCGRLFQEYVVTAWANAEIQRLRWQLKNQ